jgi:hypothetical protein
MDDETLGAVLAAFGKKLYELQLGFTTLFNIGVTNGLFKIEDFEKESKRLETHPDFKDLRHALEHIANFKEEEDLKTMLENTKFFN